MPSLNHKRSNVVGASGARPEATTRVPNRSSIRLKNFDYSQPNAYFVTICASEKKSLFGRIIDRKMILNQLGSTVGNEWQKTAKLRDEVRLDEYAIMPNHFHAIIWIIKDNDFPNMNSGGFDTNSRLQNDLSIGVSDGFRASAARPYNFNVMALKTTRS